MTRDANPRLLKPKHIVTLELPLDTADLLIAKAGSMDAAVTEALTNYLRTDLQARDARIKEFVAKGSDLQKLADFHGLTPDDILEIASN
jgi:hypothetical protein